MKTTHTERRWGFVEQGSKKLCTSDEEYYVPTLYKTKKEALAEVGEDEQIVKVTLIYNIVR